MAPAFTLTSPAFAVGEPIPRRYACDGDDVSPPLEWTEPPRGTRSLAVTMEDPDAPSGTFVHWVAWGLGPELRQLPEGVEPPVEGRNGFGTVGYRGPCPPQGHHPHHYVIRLYALQTVPDLPPGSTIGDLQDVIAEELVQAAELVGTYERP